MKLKKFFIVGFVWMMFVAGWGRLHAQQNESGAAARPKVLIVYYSRDGHTQYVAETLAKKFGGDIERLVDKKKRTGPVGTTAAGKDAVAKKFTKIGPLKHDPKEYEIVLIGTPGWFGNMTPAVRTFVEKYDLTGKKIGLFGTVHLTGIEGALDQLAEQVPPQDKTSVPRLPLRHRDLTEEVLAEKVEAFYQQIIGEK